MLKWALAALLLVSMVVQADAQAVKLGRKDDAGGIALWRDENAYAEAMSLASAGIDKTDPAMFAGLATCVVPKGTKAVVIDLGWLSSTVLIIEGASKGCRGIVGNLELTNGG